MSFFDITVFPHDANIGGELIPRPDTILLNEQCDGSPSSYCRSDDTFYFIRPDDATYLTDYLMLLFGQVKRGILNNSDQIKANRAFKYNIGFRGMRCRHCGGNEKGNYFPSSSKNLQACTTTLHTHLMRCAYTPEPVVRALKAAKTRHKYQVQSKPSGAQRIFFQMLWERIHNESFCGIHNSDCHRIMDVLDDIVKRCTFKTSSVQHIEYSHYFQLDHRKAMAQVSNNDFEIALDLLRMNPTPVHTFDNVSDVDISPEPIYDKSMVGVARGEEIHLTGVIDCHTWNNQTIFPEVGIER